MPWRPSLDWRGTAEPRYSTRQRQIGVESPMVRSFIRNGVQGSLGQTGERTGRVFLSSFEAVSSCPRTFEEPTTTTTTANHTITLTPTLGRGFQAAPLIRAQPLPRRDTVNTGHSRYTATEQWCTTFRSRIFCALSHLFDTLRDDDDEPVNPTTTTRQHTSLKVKQLKYG